MSVSTLSSPRLPHSGLGITSLVIAIVSILSLLLGAIVFAVFNRSMRLDEGYGTPAHYLMGWWYMGVCVMFLAGIVFGIGGLLQKGRRRGIAVSGLSLCILLPMLLLFIGTVASEENDGVAAHRAKAKEEYLAHHDITANPMWGRVAIGATMGAGIVIVRMRRRQLRAAKITAGTNHSMCPRCFVRQPSGMRFCRRCGLAIEIPS